MKYILTFIIIFTITNNLSAVYLGVVRAVYENETEYIYGSVEPGKNRESMDTKEKIEKLAHTLEAKYGFDTAFASKTVDNITGMVIYYGIGVDIKRLGELERFIKALKKENPMAKNIETGEVYTQIPKLVFFVTWEE